MISEYACTLADSVGRCKGSVNNWAAAVPLIHKYPVWGGVAKLLTAATGVEFTSQAIVYALERIYTLERAFLVRQGIKRSHDRIVLRPHQKGTKDGEEEIKDHEKLLSQYSVLRGWDRETGTPTRQRLESLGLKYVADELESHGPYPDWDGPPYWPLDKYPHGGNAPNVSWF